ncbi:MAG: M28 family peptidase [Flavobacteriales bacterium]|nr:M28 family peptidase [Flavobacteriales bacterium]
MKRSLLFIFLFAGITLIAQEDVSVKYANTITAEELKDHLMIFASDEFEGRETGMPGQKKAEKYIIDHFKDIGITAHNGKYTQEFQLTVKDPKKVFVSKNATTFDFLKDFYYYPGSVDGTNTYDLFFGGFGISEGDYQEISEVDVKGKVVLIFDEEPNNRAGVSRITGTKEQSEWTTKTQKKVDNLTSLGAAGIIYANKEFNKNVNRIKKFFGNKVMSLDESADVPSENTTPVFYCSYDMGYELIGDDKKLKKFKKKAFKKGPITANIGQVELSFKRNSEKVTSSNVLGYIEGTDKKDELVVITAHYDHIGVSKDGQINNGADDDGSGTVTALEIAQAFAMARDEGNGPRRSVLIMAVSGEEKGLLGSKYYTDNPIFPLENTVVDLNIDMIGRVDEAHADDSNYIYLIGADRLSKDLHELSESTNRKYSQMKLDYTFNDENDPNKFYYRSDHYNFAKNGIPVIFYFSGVHEDYHQPGDTPDKIMYDKLANVGKLIFHTAWEIANREERLKVD